MDIHEELKRLIESACDEQYHLGHKAGYMAGYKARMLEEDAIVRERDIEKLKEGGAEHEAD